MATNTSSSLLALRPVFSVDGQDREPLSTGLLRLSIVEIVSGIYRCESTFGNWGPVGNSLGYLYFDRQTLDFGKVFQVRLNAGPLFDGRITALEAQFAEGGAPEITVRAEDRFEDLRMTPRTRTFDNVSDADLVRQVASDHGLTAEVDVMGPAHEIVAQVNQSDLHFLRERVRSIDAELWMDGTTLHAQSHARRSAGTLKLSLGSALREFTVAADLDAQRTSLSVSGWDVASKSAIVQEATESAISTELNGGDSGPSILRSAFGERRESVTDTVPLDGPEAEARAEALFRMRARQFVTGRGVADTDALLRVGAYVDLQELGPLFSGMYYVTGVHHIFDPTQGMRTGFVAERPGLGRP
jgi:phage protein D